MMDNNNANLIKSLIFCLPSKVESLGSPYELKKKNKSVYPPHKRATNLDHHIEIPLCCKGVQTK